MKKKIDSTKEQLKEFEKQEKELQKKIDKELKELEVQKAIKEIDAIDKKIKVKEEIKVVEVPKVKEVVKEENKIIPLSERTKLANKTSAKDTKIVDISQEKVLEGNIKAKVMNYLHPNDQILINMEMDTGDYRTFYVVLTDETFNYKGRSYVIDTQLKYFNTSLKTYCLNYHQSLSIPIFQRYDIHKIKEGICSLDDSLSTSLNPLVLVNALESKVVKDVVAGSSFEEALKLFKILLIVIAIVSIVHFGLFIKASGILDNINLPI